MSEQIVLSENITREPLTGIESAGIRLQHSPAFLLRFFLDAFKKLLHQADLSLFVKFVLGARVDQLCTTTTQNLKKKTKIQLNN